MYVSNVEVVCKVQPYEVGYSSVFCIQILLSTQSHRRLGHYAHSKLSTICTTANFTNFHSSRFLE